MKVNITALFDITFDSDNGGSKTVVTFALPNYPQMQTTALMKQMTIEEIERLCREMVNRKVFEETSSGSPS